MVMDGDSNEEARREDDAERQNVEEDETLEARRMIEEDETLEARRMERSRSRVSRHWPKFENVGNTDTRHSDRGADITRVGRT